MPSTTYRGLLLALIEPIPRIRMLPPEDEGSPEDEMICTPGVVPASAVVTELVTRFEISSLSTMVAEPVNDSLVAVP